MIEAVRFVNPFADGFDLSTLIDALREEAPATCAGASYAPRAGLFT
jgi:hypothetical protein